jgi:hypothetical protein
VLFRHPVGELPGLVSKLERPAPAASLPEDFEARRRRLRWMLLLGLFVATIAAFALDAFGFQAGLFTRHVPLLWFAAILVVAATSPAPATLTVKPEADEPMKKGLRRVLTLSAVAAFLGLCAIQFRWAAVLYAMLAPLTLFILVREAGQAASSPPQPAPAPRPAPPTATLPPDAAQSATLQACREVLEAIADHAPHGVTATGWLDLTAGPATQERSAPHVWWRLRLPWGEGVRLRLAGLDGEHGVRLLVNLAVSPRLWLTDPGPARNASFGLLTVDSMEVTPSRISTRVLSSQRAFRAYDLIELLKSLEERLQPRPLDGSAADSPAGPAESAGDPA